MAPSKSSDGAIRQAVTSGPSRRWILGPAALGLVIAARVAGAALLAGMLVSGCGGTSTDSGRDGTAVGTTHAPGPLGRVTFTIDGAKRVTVTYADDGNPVTVSARDGSGALWTLEVPAGALVGVETISLTPLATIDAALPGPVLGGMLLEPEGILFFKPVSVSVTGGSGILHGDASGNVTFALPGDQGWGTALLSHFSPVLSFKPESPIWGEELRKVAEDTGQAMKEAREMLARRDFEIPSVPSLAWKCRDDGEWKAVLRQFNDFNVDLLQPEKSLIDRLNVGRRVGQKASLETKEVDAMVAKLGERLGEKAIRLMRATKGQSEKVLAVEYAVVYVGSYIGMGLIGANTGPLHAALQIWLETSLDPIIRAIREEHDYAQVGAAYWLAYLVNRFADKPMLETVENRLRAALKFNANVKLLLEATERPRERWEIGGSIPLVYGLGSSRGQARIRYESYHHDQGLTLEAPSFLVQAMLTKVDWCAGTATFVVDRMGGDDEARVDRSSGARFAGYAKGAFGAFYGQYESWEAAFEGKAFGFPVRVHNGKVTLIEETFDARRGTDTARFEVTVEHTPKP